MSYILSIWHTPRPADLDQAAATALVHRYEFIGLQSETEELLERLKQRYPDKVQDDQCVWSDPPLLRRYPSRVFELGIARDHEQVVPFVVATASALGLCVFDAQTTSAYLPDGTVLSPTGLHQSNDLNEATIRDVALDGLLQLLGEYGFARHGEGQTERLRATFPGGRAEVEVSVLELRAWEVRTAIHVYLDQVVDIVHASKRNTRNCSRDACHIIYFNEGEEMPRLACNNRNQLCAAVVRMCSDMARLGIPTLAQCIDMRSFDRFLKGGTGLGRYRFHSTALAAKVTVAKLAGNPDYEGFAIRELEALRPEGEFDYHCTRVDIARLLEYLGSYDLRNPSPPMHNPLDDPLSFVTGYDGSLEHHLCCIPSYPSDPERCDANRGFRGALSMLRKEIPFALYPDALVRDLFLAVAESDRRRLAIEFDMWPLATELMQRSGIDGLALVVEHMRLINLTEDLRQVPRDLAASLAERCDARAADPQFSRLADTYTKFARRFALRAVTPNPYE